MRRDDGKRSVCSAHAPVTFYWHECANGDHLTAAVDALMMAIDGPSRLRNPYAAAMNRREFTRRLQLAEQGKLRPGDHVKSIEGYPTVEMFEIRWSDIPVVERAEDGTTVNLDVHVRLYYVDLPTGLQVLGCHAHEKCTRGDTRTIREAQDREIEFAVSVYAEGFPRSWDVPELQR